MSDLTLFYGPNAGYVLELYDRYRQNPQSVDPATRAFFEQWTPPDGALPAPEEDGRRSTAPLDVAHIVGAARLIRYIREVGHMAARIDPLGSDPPGDPGLRLDIHGVTEDDLRKLPAEIVRGPLVAGSRNALEAVEKLRRAYCGAIGYETDHIQIFEERTWIREAIESYRFFYGLDDERKRELLQRLTEVETFERYLHQTFVGQKRFSLEGCDMLVPMLDSIIRNAASAGTHEIVIGMAHRGRLNVLAHILGKPYADILAEFHAANRDAGASPASKGSIGWIGDVKYHLGARRAYRESGVESTPITLAPNPSHLEFVNPVVEGRARAAQEQRDRPGAPAHDRRASLALLIHGDAAFPGQGVVAESLNLSQLAGYATGGTIHIITNNQIGFTTGPREARSTLYASDLAKGFEIPIVHVNADDVPACIAMARMAHAYREQFGKDFLIDLVGYRRWGHNEGDEPAFTQPKMYATIAAHPTVREQWADRLQQEGAISGDDADAMVAAVTERLQQARREGEAHPHHEEPPPLPPPGIARRTKTAIPAERLIELNEALLAWPEGFKPHPRLERTLDRRRTGLEQPGGIDWGHAEALAFASLLADGVPIRLSGQDSERGTFSHRHAVLHDANTGATHTPLQALPQARASFAIYNSPLSENAALGFEYGYSAHAPQVLVLWEAQFGDFANGAQVIIDQFIVSGRKKWGQTPALVLLLPHGYEGQGPEHSSARLERFLQLAAEDNIRVANLTSAVQYFHLLRRQALLLDSDPRPLIVMTPKSLLRHPRAGSSLADLAEGRFQRVIDDPAARKHADEITRLVLCTGKIYVDLLGAPGGGQAPGVAVARIEELYSFPAEELRALIDGYPTLRQVVWLQEEPRNMGAWSYIEPRLRELLDPAIPIVYVGRSASASPAEGSLVQHTVEQARIIAEAMQGSARPSVVT
ncbi:MAG: 2-oxoglutarate dehydrogenase E1 component [Roseiflexaceae bacterium]